MKGTGKRILSVSLSVMMAVGMPSGTFAAAPDAEVVEQTSEESFPTTEPEVTEEVTQQVTEEPTVTEAVEESSKEEKVQEETAEEKKEETPEVTQQSAENTKSEELPDVKVTKTELIETTEEYLVTVYTDSDVYNELYIGKKEDAQKKAVAEGKKAPNGQYEFQFSVDADKLGTRVQVVPGVKESGEWYTKQDLFCEIPAKTKVESTEISEKTEEQPIAVYEQTVENKGNVQVLKDGAPYKMFLINKTSAEMKDGMVQLTFSTNNVSYTNLYIGKNEDENKTEMAEVSVTNDEYTFVLSIPKEKCGTTFPVVLKLGKDGSWSTKNQLYMSIPTLEDLAVVAPKPTEAPVEGVPADGTYTTTTDTNNGMFKVINTKLTVENGKMTALITLSGTGYDYLYLGTGEEAVVQEKSQWIEWKDEISYVSADGQKKTGRTYEIPVDALDEEIAITAHSESKNEWYDRKITINSKDLKKVDDGSITPEPTETPTVTPTTTPTPAPSNVPSDGIYSTTAETGAAMFKVVGVKMTVKNGKMSAVITLSGEGYDYLYMGTAADAATHTGSWIKYSGTATYTLDEETKTGRTYTIPVSALDKPITVASHSESHKKWYDRTITFSSKDLKKIGDVSTGGNGNNGNSSNTNNGSTNGENNNTNGSGNTTGNTTTKVDTKPDTESKYESDTSGSTKAVNSKTKLKDGVYKPDKFSWSGGTGKVSITCDKVTIKNGQALATIVFSSSAYQYVKANGKKYLPTHTGGKSIFVIPVELNKNNSIIGMTTKMSVAHEITYSILVYLAAADESGDGSVAADGSSSGLNFGSNEKLDEKAPDIIGLEYKSETKLDYAKYFKIYHYDKDVTLLEIDMTKDTDKDPEKLKEETATKDSEKASTKTDGKNDSKSGKKKAVKITIKRNNEDSKKSDTQSITYNDEGEAVVQTQEEIIADLYKANVVKYLIVPEDSDVELPVGIEKEMIVINLPVKHAYVDSEESLNTMDDLKLLKKIAAVGYDQDETDIDAVNKALEKEDMVYAGAADDLKFREIVKNKIDLAIVSSEILPGSKTEKAAKEEEKKDGKTTKTDSTDKKTADTTDKKDSKTVNGVTVDSETGETTVLDSLADNFATLGIPLIVDRSADEKSELAKAEWLKVYGAVFGCSKKTDKLYNKAVKAAKSETK